MKVNGVIFVKLSILYIITWCISPPLSYGIIYRIIALGAMSFLILWYLKRYNFKINKVCLKMTGVIAYILMLGVMTGDNIDKRLAVVILFCFIFCAELIAECDFNKSEFFSIIFVAFILCIVWNICSLKGITETPNIMRLLAKNSGISRAYAERGVGGYSYVYTVVLLLPIGIDCMLNKINTKIERMIAAIFVFTSYILVFQAQYFLAIIMSIFSLIVYMVLKIKNPYIRSIILIITTIAFLTIYINADKVIMALINMTDVRSIDLKLQSINDLLINDGNIQDSEFGVRYERYMKDLINIGTHPLFGGFSYDVTGNHSHILDFFAQYGVPFGIIYLCLLRHPLRHIKFKYYAAGLTSVLLFLIVLFLNTLAFSFGTIIYIIMPVYYFKMKERVKYG